MSIDGPTRGGRLGSTSQAGACEKEPIPWSARIGEWTHGFRRSASKGSGALCCYCIRSSHG